MSLLQEFKKFAVKGNVMDMAVGVIIGGAFGKIVSSFVNDIVMPPIGLLTGGADFKQMKYVLKQAADGKDITLNYGMFLQNVVDFVIVAFTIFLLIRAINAMKKKEEAAPVPAPTPEPPKQEVLLTEIRDLLKERK
jgi:large conductance mechanosensitive channel